MITSNPKRLTQIDYESLDIFVDLADDSIYALKSVWGGRWTFNDVTDLFTDGARDQIIEKAKDVQAELDYDAAQQHEYADA